MKRNEATPLTSKETLEIAELLKARRAELHAARQALLSVSPTGEPGEAVTEHGERAAQNVTTATDDARAAIEKQELAEIEHALAKVDAGTFGVSEESGDPIGAARLRAKPTARVTVQEQESLEKASA